MHSQSCVYTPSISMSTIGSIVLEQLEFSMSNSNNFKNKVYQLGLHLVLRDRKPNNSGSN